MRTATSGINITTGKLEEDNSSHDVDVDNVDRRTEHASRVAVSDFEQCTWTNIGTTNGRKGERDACGEPCASVGVHVERKHLHNTNTENEPDSSAPQDDGVGKQVLASPLH
jgi:hypothetical protein